MITDKQGGLRQPRPFVEQGVKCISGLTGEVYKLEDPQESTDVQRSWLYSKDPSIGYMQKGKKIGEGYVIHDFVEKPSEALAQ